MLNLIGELFIPHTLKTYANPHLDRHASHCLLTQRVGAVRLVYEPCLSTWPQPARRCFRAAAWFSIFL